MKNKVAYLALYTQYNNFAGANINYMKLSINPLPRWSRFRNILLDSCNASPLCFACIFKTTKGRCMTCMTVWKDWFKHD